MRELGLRDLEWKDPISESHRVWWMENFKAIEQLRELERYLFSDEDRIVRIERPPSWTLQKRHVLLQLTSGVSMRTELFELVW